MSNSKFSYYYNLLINPKFTKTLLYSKFVNNIDILNLHSIHCHNNGITKPNFLLSFDCDTTKDADTCISTHSKLINNNIYPMYAVPSEIIEISKKIYIEILNNSGEFINHGYRSHTSYNENNNEYSITLNYNNLKINEIRSDIVKAHEYLKMFLNKNPNTFRTPHFGFVQKQSKLNSIYDILLSLNYQYSSSTNPFYGICNHTIPINYKGLYEFPLSGAFSNPLSIIDSWKYIIKDNKLSKTDFINELESYLKYFKDFNKPFFLNIYADPSHIANWDDFFLIMKDFNKYNIRNYSQVS